MKTKERVLRNEELKKVAEIAVNNGLEVWTFKSSSKYIEQVFFTDGKKIGTVSARFGGLSYGTVHKPSRNVGSGYGLNDSQDVESASLEMIQESMNTICPNWDMQNAGHVKKYKSWDEYISRGNVLTYYQLEDFKTQ